MRRIFPYLSLFSIYGDKRKFKNIFLIQKFANFSLNESLPRIFTSTFFDKRKIFNLKIDKRKIRYSKKMSWLLPICKRTEMKNFLFSNKFFYTPRHWKKKIRSFADIITIIHTIAIQVSKYVYESNSYLFFLL